MTSLPRSGDEAFDAAVAAELSKSRGGLVVIAVPSGGKILRSLVRPLLLSLPLTAVFGAMAYSFGLENARAGRWLWASTGVFFLVMQLPHWIRALRAANPKRYYVVGETEVLLSLGTQRILPYGYLADVAAPPARRGAGARTRRILLSVRDGTSLEIPDDFGSDPDETYALLRERFLSAETEGPPPLGDAAWQICICARLDRATPPAPHLDFEGFDAVAESADCVVFRCRHCGVPYADYRGRTRIGSVSLRQSLGDDDLLRYKADAALAARELHSSLDTLLTDQRLEYQRDRTHVGVASRTGDPKSQYVPLREYDRYW